MAGFVLGIAVSTVSASLAQLPRQTPAGGERVVSGDRVGFRIDGTDPRTGRPIGAWVVEIDGAWVEAGAAPGIRPAK